MTTRFCKKCGKSKPLNEFSKNKTKPDGLQSNCKSCNMAMCLDWEKRNPDKKSAKDKRYLQAHPDKRRAKRHRHYLKYAEKIIKRVVQWYTDHPEKQEAKNRNRHIKTRGGAGKVSAAEWEMILRRFENKCVIPGCERTDLTVDHIVPLALGGTHTVDNIQPMCRHHNCSKGARAIDYRSVT
jgi:5-methylcytosine-specific restriction endonuclease McrA